MKSVIILCALVATKSKYIILRTEAALFQQLRNQPRGDDHACKASGCLSSVLCRTQRDGSLIPFRHEGAVLGTCPCRMVCMCMWL